MAFIEPVPGRMVIYTDHEQAPSSQSAASTSTSGVFSARGVSTSLIGYGLGRQFSVAAPGVPPIRSPNGGVGIGAASYKSSPPRPRLQSYGSSSSSNGKSGSSATGRSSQLTQSPRSPAPDGSAPLSTPRTAVASRSSPVPKPVSRLVSGQLLPEASVLGSVDTARVAPLPGGLLVSTSTTQVRGCLGCSWLQSIVSRDPLYQMTNADKQTIWSARHMISAYP